MRFQFAPESLARSYRKLQGRVQSLTPELERGREKRIRLKRLVDLLIVAEDTGSGIQEEELARIFDPMFSTSCELPTRHCG